MENIQKFVYLSSLDTCNNECMKEIKIKIGEATTATTELKKMWT